MGAACGRTVCQGLGAIVCNCRYCCVKIEVQKDRVSVYLIAAMWACCCNGRSDGGWAIEIRCDVCRQEAWS